MTDQDADLGPISPDEKQRILEQKTIIVFMKWLANLPAEALIRLPRRFVKWMQIGAQMKGAEEVDKKRNAS